MYFCLPIAVKSRIFVAISNANYVKKWAELYPNHAEALVEDWEDYAPDELLAIALDTLRETLDAAVYWGYDEIRYIHGKGKGQLRRWVYEELRHYQNDALIEKFYPSYQNEDIVVVVIGF